VFEVEFAVIPRMQSAPPCSIASWLRLTCAQTPLAHKSWRDASVVQLKRRSEIADALQDLRLWQLVERRESPELMGVESQELARGLSTRVMRVVVGPGRRVVKGVYYRVSAVDVCGEILILPWIVTLMPLEFAGPTTSAPAV